ncbi:unnamed protein product [Trifolium pratense]|uniref:Uncharacterized protein n=1 Tax=Trifolium pratense TaxID=57577 RepID=A0ACB0J5E7_TRIPR|nr:unnamed protein product [Trifolium pratense]
MPKKYQITIHRKRLQEAAAFINQVKVVFKDNNEKYSEFIQVMMDFKNKKTDTLGVFEMVIKVFKGHTDLLLEFNSFMPAGSLLSKQASLVPLYHDHKQVHQLVIKDAFLNKVKLVFQDNMEIYFKFLQVINDHKAQGIDIRGVVAIVKELFKGHKNLILGFNAFLPKEYKIKLITFKLHGHNKTGKRVKKVAENGELPWDVLDIISKTLDIDDHFEFACVCKNWRAFHKMYWRSAFEEPLVVHKSSYVNKSYSFTSISNQKDYQSNMINYYWHFAYSGSSSGYLIMTGNNNSFMLINPFTRRKKFACLSISKC